MAATRLEVKISGDASSFTKATGQAQKEAQGFARTLGKLNSSGVSKLSSGLSRFGSTAGGAIGGVISKLTSLGGALSSVAATGPAGLAAVGAAAAGMAAAVVGGLFHMAQAAAEWAGNVRKIKAVTGATAEDASRLVVVFHSLGISTDAGARAFQLFGKNLTNAGKNFKRWFTSAEIADMRSQDLSKTLPKLAEKFNGLETAAQKSAFMMDVFGRSGANLRPLLVAGKQQLQDLAKAADQLGLIFTDKQLEEAKQFQISLRELQLQAESLGISIGRTVIPAFNSMFGAINQGLMDLRGANGLGSQLSTIGKIAGGVAAIGTGQLPLAFKSFGSIGSQETDKVRQKLVEAQMATEEFEKKVAELSPKFGEVFKSVDLSMSQLQASFIKNAAALQSFSSNIQVIAGRIRTMFPPEVVSDFLAQLQELGPGAAKLVDEMAGSSDEAIRKLVGAFDAQKKAAEGAARSLQGTQKEAEKAGGKFDATKKKAQDLGRTKVAPKIDANTSSANARIADTGKRLKRVNDTIARPKIIAKTDQANSAIGHVLSLLRSIPRSITTVVKTIYQKITGKQHGGRVLRTAPYIVGERGPELFLPESNGSIVPAGRTRAMLADKGHMTKTGASSGLGGRSSGGWVTVNNIHVQGSIVTERELQSLIHRQLLRHGFRNATTEIR